MSVTTPGSFTATMRRSPACAWTTARAPVASGAAVAQECPAGEECVLTMNYWCDIDRAEAANLGGVIGFPLQLDVFLFEEHNMPAGAQVNFSAVARLESKN